MASPLFAGSYALFQAEAINPDLFCKEGSRESCGTTPQSRPAAQCSVQLRDVEGPDGGESCIRAVRFVVSLRCDQHNGECSQSQRVKLLLKQWMRGGADPAVLCSQGRLAESNLAR